MTIELIKEREDLLVEKNKIEAQLLNNKIQLTTLRTEAQELGNRKSEIDKKLNSVNARLAAAKAGKEKAIVSGQATVTDHALLRFVERVYGVDVEQFREMISNSVKGFKNGDVSLQGYDSKAVLKDGVVVTVKN